MYNNLVFVSNIPDFKMTYHLLDSLGYSNESIVILLKLDSLVDLYGTDSLMFLQNASILKNQISTINNDFEQCIVAKAIELGIATNKFWNEHNNLIHGSVLYRKGPNNVQKADIVGFVTGAWEGAKWGAVAAGGIPGAIAGGLLGGAASSLGASAWAYFLPNAWWNPWA